MFNALERSKQLELIDTEDISFEEFQETLKQIELINNLSCSHQITLAAIKKLYQNRAHQKEPLKIVDIGSGSGSYLRFIERWSDYNKINSELIGVDLNPWSKRTAEKSESQNIKYINQNVFDYKPKEKVDIFINSLFMHHLKDHEIVELIAWMTENSNYGWFINDLHRNKLAYEFIKQFTKIFNFNRYVKHDACLSVARSFRKKDWLSLLQKAGLDMSKVKIKWHANFRYSVYYEH